MVIFFFGDDFHPSFSADVHLPAKKIEKKLLE